MSNSQKLDYGDLEVSERILLARIDERLKSVESRLLTIETKLISTSEHETLLQTEIRLVSNNQLLSKRYFTRLVFLIILSVFADIVIHFILWSLS